MFTVFLLFFFVFGGLVIFFYRLTLTKMWHAIDLVSYVNFDYMSCTFLSLANPNRMHVVSLWSPRWAQVLTMIPYALLALDFLSRGSQKVTKA